MDDYAKEYVLVEVHERKDTSGLPGQEFPQSVRKHIKEQIDKAIDDAVKAEKDSDEWKKDDQNILKYGWAGAGIWYNKIAQINGALVTAVMNVPRTGQYPHAMVTVRKQNLEKSANSAGRSAGQGVRSERRKIYPGIPATEKNRGNLVQGLHILAQKQGRQHPVPRQIYRELPD